MQLLDYLRVTRPWTCGENREYFENIWKAVEMESLRKDIRLSTSSKFLAQSIRETPFVKKESWLYFPCSHMYVNEFILLRAKETFIKQRMTTKCLEKKKNSKIIKCIWNNNNNINNIKNTSISRLVRFQFGPFSVSAVIFFFRYSLD